jgi:hypothetical protein
MVAVAQDQETLTFTVDKMAGRVVAVDRKTMYIQTLDMEFLVRDMKVVLEQTLDQLQVVAVAVVLVVQVLMLHHIP